MLDYVVVPSWVYASASEQPAALRVLLCLMFNRNTRTNRTHFMTKREIADRSNISRQYAYKVLEWLECKGLIEAIAVRRGEYMYYLACLENVEEAEATDELTYEQQMAVAMEAYNNA